MMPKTRPVGTASSSWFKLPQCGPSLAGVAAKEQADTHREAAVQQGNKRLKLQDEAVGQGQSRSTSLGSGIFPQPQSLFSTTYYCTRWKNHVLSGLLVLSPSENCEFCESRHGVLDSHWIQGHVPGTGRQLLRLKLQRLTVSILDRNKR